jgi:hypothetical protein
MAPERLPAGMLLTACAAFIALAPAVQAGTKARALPLDPATPFFGARFEPHGVYHMAQGETSSAVVWECPSGSFACDIGTIKKYKAASGRKPIGVLQYITRDDWTPAEILSTIRDKRRIPQIGIGFWPSGELHVDDTAAAASGAYDGFWSAVARLVRGSKEPVFIRPGFEFGGSGAGEVYDPVNYKLAFRRMVDLFRAEGATNVAFIWDQYNEPNYMNFYPGDEYVDWWGINLFHNGDFTSPSTVAFMNDALVHGKPVMICEASPKDQPVTDPASWSLWYGPYFDFVKRYAHLKGIAYINSSWAQWPDFKESRIELDPAGVQPLYAAEIADPRMLHHEDDGGAGILFGPAIDVRPGAAVTAGALSSTTATVSWKTLSVMKKQPGTTTSRVEFGTTTAYGTRTPEDMTLVLDHAVELTGLTPATTYHFRVGGFDGSGFEIRSGDFTFTTLP